MNGETSTILQLFETVGVIGILGLIFYLFFTGNLISRAIHNEILEVYKAEIKKLTEEITETLMAIGAAQKETLEYMRKLNGKT